MSTSEPLPSWDPGEEAAALEYALFDPAYYLAQRPDAADTEDKSLVHYLQYGWREGVNPCPLFDVRFYLSQRPDVAAARVEPFLHYLRAGRAEGCQPHPLFDPTFYFSQRPELARSGVEPLQHYLEGGWREGLKPHPLFDVDFYLEQRPDVVEARLEPLRHYLAHGWREGTKPHPLFDPGFYLAHRPDVAEAGVEPLSHYLLAGWREWAWPHPLFNPTHRADYRVDPELPQSNPLLDYVMQSEEAGKDPHALFDTRYYLAQVEEMSGLPPLQHYLVEGWKQGHSPHPVFDSSFYVDHCHDIEARAPDPLTHYVTIGWRIGAWPHPLFNRELYLQQRPEVARQGVDPLAHYLTLGWRDDAKPHLLFEPIHYRSQCEGGELSIAPLVHYLSEGWKQGKRPHPLFDLAFYLSRYPAVAESGDEPLAHYVRSGWRERHWPHPLFNPDYYLEQRADLVMAGTEPLMHYVLRGDTEPGDPHPLFDTRFYLEEAGGTGGLPPLQHYVTEGWLAGRSPHPLFDPDYYIDRLKQTEPVAQEPLSHYLARGWHAQPHPLFDPAFYLRNFLGDEIGQKAPLLHYAESGWEAAADPHPLFDTSLYLDQHPDRARERTPLEHYVRRGWRDALRPHVLFDPAFYLAQCPESAGSNPLIHFLLHGRGDNKRPTAEDISGIIDRLIALGDLERAASLHAMLSTRSRAWARRGLVLPLRGLRSYAEEHGCLLKEFAAEETSIPETRCFGRVDDTLVAERLPGLSTFVAQIEGAVVLAGTKVVVTDDGTVLHDAAARHAHDPEIEIDASDLLPRVSGEQVLLNFDRRPVHRIEEGVLLTSECDTSYARWLLEALPAVAMLDSLPHLAEWPLLVRDDLPADFYRALYLANVKDRPVIRLRDRAAYQVGRLTIPSNVTLMTRRVAGSAGTTADFAFSRRWTCLAAETVQRRLAPAELPRQKLFATRRSAPHRLANNEQIEVLLARDGFMIEEFDRTSFDYAILRWSQSPTVVAAAGDCLANMIFSPKGSRLIVLTCDPSAPRTRHLRHLAGSLGHDICFVVGSREYTGCEDPADDDYTVAGQDVRSALKHIGALQALRDADL
ncbi:glycosyltransferase family 61 protein [Lutibaculum baratangense]|uniref:Uncharacterized protein n=1 Tax=Lutibaculum baratangense AMV1 TaxID=631454 RepID=V4RN71_9HYPH|nr:glycosyltransferase family 61 protein [Lutibaculum baratangense]ESR27431.1 hypothetical protein N177_0125 [Lutibaculum baratangense AMV1]